MMGRWFHRNISGIEAQKLLEKFGQEGSFLIRSSQSTANSYTLSVRCSNGIKHIKIQNSTDSGFEIGQGSGDQFATLSELVEHFIMKESLRDKMDGSIIVLRYPLSPKEPTCERYFHGSISGKEASDLLLAKGKLGSYLVRESRTDPQNYVLSVLCENQKVVHLVINCNDRGYTTPNLDKYFPTLDEFIANCIKMCPIVDVKDNVVYLKQPLNCSRVNAMNFNTRCQELEAESRLRNKNGLSEEFEALQQADGKFLFERKDGCKPENRAKNRFKTILPFDYNRIKLLNRGNRPDDPNDSDYINANRIKCDETFGKVYLATQGPLSSTMGDFWEMIWQEKCQIILMITHEEEKGRIKCAKYWPIDSAAKVNISEETYGRINVKLVKKTLICDDYLVREFVVSCPMEDPTHTRKCYQFQYLAWSDHGVPENPHVTLSFIEHFNKLYSELDKAPVTVHCSAGIGRTGAIIVIDHLIDKLNTYGLQCDIDIYKTVHSLRSQRSGMIQTEKQYQFLYSIIRLYIDAMLDKLNRSSGVDRTIESDFQVSNNIIQHPPPVASSSGTARKLNSYFTSTPKSLSLQSINIAPPTSSNQLLNNLPVRK